VGEERGRSWGHRAGRGERAFGRVEERSDGGAGAEEEATPGALKALSYIAANVRRLRTERGLTQQGLAEALGVDLRTAQRIESGKADVAVSTLVALGEILGVKPAALLKEAEMPEVKRGRPGRG